MELNTLNSIFKKFFNIGKTTVLVQGREEPEANVLEVLNLLIEQRENEGVVFRSRHLYLIIPKNSRPIFEPTNMKARPVSATKAC